MSMDGNLADDRTDRRMTPAGPTPGRPARPAPNWRLLTLCGTAVALLCVILARAADIVPAGTAVVITGLGQQPRVVTLAGLAWQIPAPLQTAQHVGLRLHLACTDPTDVQTRDGVRLLVQVFAAWQVAADPTDIVQFVTGAGNDPGQTSRQIAAQAAAAARDIVGGFTLPELLNPQPGKSRLAEAEAQLQTRLQAETRHLYGVTVRQAGFERLTLTPDVLAATVSRLRSEHATVAAQDIAEGRREAAQIRADADRDSRIMIADAQTQAAAIEAEARRQAAAIQGKAYAADPQLYMMLRSMDTLGSVIGPNTRLVLRTDAAPFNALVQGPPAGEGGGDVPAK
jgi:membrane protease subunit HflC